MKSKHDPKLERNPATGQWIGKLNLDTIDNMRSEGLKIRDIAKFLGVSKQAVYKKLK